MTIPSYIVFTDLDGTLLDHHTYSPAESLPGLALLQQKRIPVVFCSAKTRTEQLPYRRELGVRDPFIVENGGAVFVETGYFRQAYGLAPAGDGLDSVTLARPREEVRRILAEVASELQLPLRGYGDLTVEEVAEVTGLDRAAAERARQREFEETIVTPLSDADRARLREALGRHGVTLTAGARFTSASTANDKGRATRLLTEMYRRERGEVVTVGIGDSWNDAPMLAATDIALLVQRPGGTWAALEVDGIRPIDGVGPKGWTAAMRQLVNGALGRSPNASGAAEKGS